MRAAALITGLYPPPVRERWGAEISQELAESGLRSWPDTLAGAARLWLHPSDWPETLPGQTRRVLAVALFAVIAATGLVVRAIEPTVTTDPHRPATSLWSVPILLGVALAAPLPRSILRLTVTAARTLTAPAIAFLALVLIARSGLVGHHPAALTGAALVGYYWATLGFVALRLCTLVARVARTAVMPTTRRLRAALLLIGTGLTIAAAQNLLSVLRTAGPGTLAAALALGLLAAATISAGHDLRAAA